MPWRGVPKHGELLHAEEAAALDLLLAAGLDRLAGLLPLDLGRPAAGVVGRQRGKLKLQPRLANGSGDLVRIDTDRTIQGLADDVFFQAEIQVQQMLAGQETDAGLLGRGRNLADSELFQKLDVARAKLPLGLALDLKALERYRAGKKSHFAQSFELKLFPYG